jgi:hypothetical protein
VVNRCKPFATGTPVRKDVSRVNFPKGTPLVLFVKFLSHALEGQAFEQTGRANVHIHRGGIVAGCALIRKRAEEVGGQATAGTADRGRPRRAPLPPPGRRGIILEA